MTNLNWKAVSKYPSVLVTVDERFQQEHLTTLAKYLEEKNIRTSIICVNHTFDMHRSSFSEAGLSLENFVFIDTLTPKEAEVEDERVFFTNYPRDLDLLLTTLQQAQSTHDCELILVDSLSSFLSWRERHDILRFTNDLKDIAEKGDDDIVLFAVKQDSFPKEEGRQLLADLQMFVESTISLEKA